MDPFTHPRDPRSPAPSAPPSAWPHPPLLLLSVLLLSLAFSACAAIPREATDALERSWELIEPWAVQAIESEPDLDPTTRAARRRLVAEHGRMIQELRRYADSAQPPPLDY